MIFAGIRESSPQSRGKMVLESAVTGRVSSSILKLVDLCRDAIHVTTTLRRQPTASVRILFHQSHRFQGLKNSPGDGLGGAHEVAGRGAIALAGAVNLGKGTHASWRTDVQMTRHRRRTHVEPVLVMRSLLVEAGELDEVGPFGDGHLAGFLEEIRESDDELLLIHVFHAAHFDDFNLRV